MDGYFNMMAIVDTAETTKDIAAVAKELDGLGKDIGVNIQCQREEIFEKMHRL